jgi:tetratricopeptide (TPR) repeat protein
VTETEVPLTEGDGALRPPQIPDSLFGQAAANRIALEYTAVEEQAERGAYRAALDLIEAWPETFEKKAGSDFHLLWGYLVYKCGDFHTAVKILEPLLLNDQFVKRRPALLYYLGRAYYGDADFAKSVEILEKWIEYRKNIGKPVVPPSRSTGSPVITVMPE